LLALAMVGPIMYRKGKTVGMASHEDGRSPQVQQVVSDLFAEPLNPSRNAISVLDDHFSDPEFGIVTWARETGYSSTRQLQRIVKDLTGTTPEKLLWLRRVNESERLLHDNSHLNISEIAFKVGFKDQSHFTRKFRELKGETPSAVRAKHSDSRAN